MTTRRSFIRSSGSLAVGSLLLNVACNTGTTTTEAEKTVTANAGAKAKNVGI